MANSNALYEHHAFEWHLINAHLIVASEFTIESPVFVVESSLTQWRLILHFYHSTADNSVYISIRLAQLAHIDSQEVEASFIFRLKAKNKNITLCSPVGFHMFSREMNTCGSTFVRNEEDFVFLFGNDWDGVLIVSCEVLLNRFVDDTLLNSNNSNQNITELSALADDLRGLLYGNFYPGDMCFVNEEGCIMWAHKDILSLYSSELRNYFNDHREESAIDLPYSREAIMLMLKYIYARDGEITHDFRHYLQVRQMAIDFKLVGLKKTLKPQRSLYNSTLILPDLFRCTFTIPNFPVLSPNDIFSAYTGFPNIQSKISVSFEMLTPPVSHEQLRRNGTSPEALSNRRTFLYGEALHLDEVSSLTITLSIRNPNRDVIFQRVACFPTEFDNNSQQSICHFFFYIPETCIQNVSLPDHKGLEINLSFKCTYKNQSNVSEVIYEMDGTPENRFHSIDDSLSNQMELLQKSELNTNINIYAGGDEYPAHKSVLSARSSVFNRVFSQSLVNNTCNLTIPSTVAKQLLNYIYTARFCVQNVQELLDLLIAAETFDVSGLKEKCFQLLLHSQLTLTNVYSILQISGHFNHTELKRKCMDYIAIFQDSILVRPQWRDLMRQNSALGSEVLQFIRETSRP